MNILQQFTRYIIRQSFHGAVNTMERFNDMTEHEQKVAYLRTLPQGTLGKDIATCLDEHKLRLVPGFESHDLKHVLLGYEMTPVDEIRLQAFMLGNGNITPASIAIFVFGALLLPELWFTFIKDFMRGMRTVAIASFSIDACCHCRTSDLQNPILDPVHTPQVMFHSITRAGAFTAIFMGVFGMLFCLPYLFSSSVADLIGAGFPFLAGAIMASAGLLALSNVPTPVTLQPA